MKNHFMTNGIVKLMVLNLAVILIWLRVMKSIPTVPNVLKEKMEQIGYSVLAAANGFTN